MFATLLIPTAPPHTCLTPDGPPIPTREGWSVQWYRSAVGAYYQKRSRPGSRDRWMVEAVPEQGGAK